MNSRYIFIKEALNPNGVRQNLEKEIKTYSTPKKIGDSYYVAFKGFNKTGQTAIEVHIESFNLSAIKNGKSFRLSTSSFDGYNTTIISDHGQILKINLVLIQTKGSRKDAFVRFVQVYSK